MFVTDITNCYGSVNPQSIEWALNMKGTSHETNSNSQIAVNIQKYLRAFQYGRNIGIPQGSAIFDFVGEIILGYSDLLLHEAIKKAKRNHKITGSYEIIRYRDDYRIFCNDKDELETISYILQQVLECLNFRMNSQKTKISDSIVTDAIKHDKLAYIYNTPIFNKKGVDFDSFEKHLLFILLFGRENPNSGQLKTLLSDIDKRIEEWLKPYEEDVKTISILDDTPKVTKKGVVKQRRLVGGSVRAMSAVCVQIAIENVSVSHYALRVFSRMVDSLKDNKEKWDIINKVYSRLVNQPNSSYNQLWLQNITFQQDVKEKKSPYDMRLCKLVMGEEVQLWNNQWLKDELKSSFPILSVVNSEFLAKAMDAHVITFRETRAYAETVEENFEIDLDSIPKGSY